MSSSTFAITLLAASAGTVQLRVRSLTDGANDHASTPMFALMELAEARTRAGKKGKPGALEAAAAAWPARVREDHAFWTTRLPTYIAGTTVKRVNQVKGGTLPAKLVAARTEIEAATKRGRAREDALCAVLPHAIVDVKLADAKWANGLSTDWVWETTGYDPPPPPKPKAVKPGPEPIKAVKGGDFTGKQLARSFTSSRSGTGWSPDGVEDLGGSNFTRAKLDVCFRDMALKACTFDGATFLAKDVTEIADCVFTGSSFVGTTLRGMTFKGCDFTGCDFTNADLRDATIDGGAMTKAILTGAKLTGATIDDRLLAQALGGPAKKAGAPAVGPACKAYAKLVATAEQLEVGVLFASKNIHGEYVKLRLLAVKVWPRQPPTYKVILCAGDSLKGELSGREARDVKDRAQVGAELLILGKHADVPKDRKLDLATLTIAGKKCALKGPALRTAVVAMLGEIFTVP